LKDGFVEHRICTWKTCHFLFHSIGLDENSIVIQT
jgi:hypothetical protein